MKVGDLVFVGSHSYIDDGSEDIYGIIVEVINSELLVPPVVKVMWEDGTLGKEWTDDLEVVSAYS